MTKWQAFATAKGIAPKPRRDRLIYDAEKQDWVPKWGYKGKNKEIESQWIVEVPTDKGTLAELLLCPSTLTSGSGTRSQL